jgi:hypothetical protein
LRSLTTVVSRWRSVGETAKDIPVRMRQTRIRFRQRESQARTLMLGFVALCYFSLAVPGHMRTR